MDKFNEAFELVVGHEGNFQNLRWDRGNWTSGVVGIGKNKGTKYGVTAMSYPNLDIKNLTLEDAKRIYKQNYWNAFYKPDMPAAIQLVMLDTAINSGVGKAKELLARSGYDARSYLDYREAYLRTLGEREAYKNALNGWLNRIKNLRAQVEHWELVYPALPDDPVSGKPQILLDVGRGFEPVTERYEDDRIVVNPASDKIHIRLK